MPEIDASVSTRVVSWNDAAQMNDSVESDAFVIPSNSGRPVPGRPPATDTRSFSSMKPNRSTCCCKALPDPGPDLTAAPLSATLNP